MAMIRVPYGDSFLAAEVPEDAVVDVIELEEPEPVIDPVAQVQRALAEPIGGFVWRPATSVAIAVNDKTRPVPHDHLLPPLLARLTEAGIAGEAITFFVAVGGHAPMDPTEFPGILPAHVLDHHRIVSHDARSGDLVALGTTSRGTPVRINREYAESQLKIVVGTIEPHQFAGYSGGVKSAAIGLAGLETIDRNHAWMADPASRIGTYATNPARQDIEEIGEMIGVDLALNVLLDSRRRIVDVLAGQPIAVMEAGVPRVQARRQMRVPERYDVVVTSPGGHPKDINVYQAQKAVSSAAAIVRPGGTIVLVAACPEGSGSTAYEDWASARTSQADVLEAFAREGFRIGAHKAFQIARDSVDTRLVVCSEMPDELARRLLLETAPSLQAAVDDAMIPGGRIAVLPHASTTIAYVE